MRKGKEEMIYLYYSLKDKSKKNLYGALNENTPIDRFLYLYTCWSLVGGIEKD